jgi:hypothetical protein
MINNLCNNFKMKNPKTTKIRPLKATRKYCLWCCNDSKKEIKLCPSENCPLHSLRFGKNPLNKSVLKAIRENCLDCIGDFNPPQDVKLCSSTDCPLHPFRFGHNPARKGIGNHQAKICKKIRTQDHVPRKEF